MAFSFTDLLPKSTREQWVEAKNKARLENPPPPSSLADILYRATASAQDAFKRSTAEAALNTGEGKQFQQEATRVTVKQYLQNPALWIVGAILLYGLLALRR